MHHKKIILLALPLLLVLVLGLSIARAIQPPELAIASPRDGEVLQSPVASLSGIAPGAAQLSVNGVIVPLTAADGSFSAGIPLHPGVNLLRIRARKRHSGNRTVELRVIYQPTVRL